jgi:alkylhydroperoxidase family enzyme
MPTSLLRLQEITRHTVIDGPGSTDPALRRQIAAGHPPPELAALVKKIFDHPYAVTDDDVDRLRRSYSEAQLFEVIVAAAVGASGYRLTAALTAVERA